VLKNTFLHVPGVGPKTEKRIWQQGVYSWSDFLQSSVPQIPRGGTERIRDYLVLSEEALERGDAEFFTRTLPRAEWWRLFTEFREETVFLDIETTGLSFYYNEVTLIGLSNGKGAKIYLRGYNLPDFKEEIRKYSLVVTFNGTLFDLPFLRGEFGELELPPVHIDLRFLLKRLGYSGGLKSIEEKFGIVRGGAIKDIDGFGATKLWNSYLRGDRSALELLIKYNIADVANLETLMACGYHMMKQRLPVRTDTFEDIWNLLAHAGNNGFDDEQALSSLASQGVLSDLGSVSVGDSRSNGTNMETLSLAASEGTTPPKVLGIDLRASEDRYTGWATVEGSHVETGLLKTDKELIDLAGEIKPDVISIDSPLSLPKGRDCTNDACECRRFGITRECERTLRHRAINVFPCLLPSMQGLTQRGMRLADQLRDLGFSVIESYPGAAQDIMGIVRKKISVEGLRQGLIDFGLSGEFASSKVTHDELDAITSALVAYFYLSGDYEALGNEDEEYLIVPELNGRARVAAT